MENDCLLSAFVAGFVTLVHTQTRPSPVQLLNDEGYAVTSSVWVDDALFAVHWSNGETTLRSTNDFRAWHDLVPPPGHVEAVGLFEGRLAVGVSTDTGVVEAYVLENADSWSSRPLLRVAIGESEPHTFVTHIANNSLAVVKEGPETLELHVAGANIEERHRRLPIAPISGRVRSHPRGFLIESGALDNSWVLYDLENDEQLEIVLPDGPWSVSSHADGRLIATREFGENIGALVSEAPFDTWSELRKPPSQLFDPLGALASCGSVLRTNEDASLLMNYSVCDGRVWVSETNGPWVQAEDFGVGDGDSVVEPVAIVDGRAIINSYEGVVAVDMADVG